MAPRHTPASVKSGDSNCCTAIVQRYGVSLVALLANAADEVDVDVNDGAKHHHHHQHHHKHHKFSRKNVREIVVFEASVW